MIHLGDLSRPETACSDNWLRQSPTFWQRELVKPVFYTPGDNDWADCDRESLAVRQSEIEGLQQLRTILFSSPKTVTPGWQLEDIDAVVVKGQRGRMGKGLPIRPIILSYARSSWKSDTTLVLNPLTTA